MEASLHALVGGLREAFKEPQKVIITTHQGPDGDAIGSMMSLYLFLTKAGHQVTPVVPSDYPAFLHWVPQNDQVLNFLHQKKRVVECLGEADWIFYLDFNHLDRTSGMSEFLGRCPAKKVLVDHHLNPEIAVDFSFSDPRASSTACLLFKIMLEWNRSLIDVSIATCAYMGLMTDTGCFSYNIKGPETFELVAELMRYGIDRDAIYRKVYDNFSESRMRLLGYCLNEKMEVFPEFSAALISLTLDDQKRYNFAVGDSESFVNYPLSIGGVVFSAFFQEKEDKIKISFRSRGVFSVNDFARAHFEGGGHMNASGGECRLSMEETLRKFRDLLPVYGEYLKK